MLRHLEAIGPSGENLGNANRELQTYVGEPNAPKEQVFDIPVRVLGPTRANTDTTLHRSDDGFGLHVAAPLAKPHVHGLPRRVRRHGDEQLNQPEAVLD